MTCKSSSGHFAHFPTHMVGCYMGLDQGATRLNGFRGSYMFVY